MTAMAEDRQLEAELLGAYLWCAWRGWPQPWRQVDDLTGDLFTTPAHRSIARAIGEAHLADDRTLDRIAGILAEHGWLGPIGGRTQLERLAAEAPAISRTAQQIHLLQGLARKRRRLAELEAERTELMEAG